MARSRQRRKQRQQDRRQPEAGGVAPELRDEADADSLLEPRHPDSDDPTGRSGSEPEGDGGGEEIYDDVSAAELIATIVPLRRSRRHPLVPGIRMFTAMLEEARGGYAADRLDQLEEALGIDFNALEQRGILQVAMAQMDELGVPDVEHGVQVALEARAEVEEQGIALEEDKAVAEDLGDDLPGVDEEIEGDEDSEPISNDEPEDPDAPGPDEQ